MVTIEQAREARKRVKELLSTMFEDMIPTGIGGSAEEGYNVQVRVKRTEDIERVPVRVNDVEVITVVVPKVRAFGDTQ